MKLTLTHDLAAGEYDDGVADDVVIMLDLTVEEPMPPASPVEPPAPAPTPPSPAPSSPPAPAPAPAPSGDVPAVVVDGLSVLYHYPMTVELESQIDTIEVPQDFGGSPILVPKIAWNFGDGENGFGADGRHPYAAPGTYTITGSVSYKDGRLVPFGPLTAVVD